MLYSFVIHESLGVDIFCKISVMLIVLDYSMPRFQIASFKWHLGLEVTRVHPSNSISNLQSTYSIFVLLGRPGDKTVLQRQTESNMGIAGS